MIIESQPKVIGIVGHIRSGKTTATNYLASKYGARIFLNSQPIGKLISILDWTHDRKTYANLSMALFDTFGTDLIARHWIRKMKNSLHAPLYVVDGIRYPDEPIAYKEQTNFALVAIASTDTNRFNRSQSANDSHKDQGQSFSDFIKQKEIRNELYVDGLVSKSDYLITNDNSLPYFYSQIDLILKKIVDSDFAIQITTKKP